MTDILELAKAINKTVGVKEGGVITQDSPALKVDRFRTGSLSYDIITGGGVPKQRMTVVEGMESSGKSTFSLKAVSGFMKQDDRAVFYVDTEHTFDMKYAENQGIDTSRLLVVQPDCLEDASDFVKAAIETGQIGLLVFDSLKAALPRKIIEEGIDSHNIGLHAKMIGTMLGSINPKLKPKDLTVILVNQQREDPGSFTHQKVSPGGNAIKFYASIRIEILRGSKKDDQQFGKYQRGRAKTLKNKTYPPFKEAEYNMQYGLGIDTSVEVLDYGTEIGVLYKKGHSYYYDKTFKNDPEKHKDHVCLGVGKRAARDFLNDNLEFRDMLYDTILLNWFDENE